MQAEKDLQSKVKQCQKEKIGKNLVIDVGSNMELLAGSKITIKTGGASITLSSSGSIDISGILLSINGTTIAFKAGAISLN
jgi:type VI secretion system secreted protein VgrG